MPENTKQSSRLLTLSGSWLAVVSTDEAKMFLRMMDEVYPHLMEKAMQLKNNLEGVIPSTFFFEIDEQIENLQKMRELLTKQVAEAEKAKQEAIKAIHENPQDIFGNIGGFIKDVKDVNES